MRTMEHRHSQNMDFGAFLADQEDAPVSQDVAAFLREDKPYITRHLDDPILENGNDTLTKLDSNRKPMPAPIYDDSPFDGWSSRPSSHFSQNAAQPPSRCPSLMSNATLSSRNSSTRSTRSLQSIGRHFSRRSKKATDDTSAMANSEHSSIQSTRFTAQVVELCPWKGCERHLRGFTKAGDRERHLLVHCETTLVCGFCRLSPSHRAVFGEGPDRVPEFLKHLMWCHYDDFSCSPIQYSGMEPAYTDLAECPICKTRFTAGSMYEHLPDCVGREVTRMADSSVWKYRASDDVQCDTSVNVTTRRGTLVSKYDEGRPSVHDAQNEFDEKSELTYLGCGDIAELTASSSRLSLVSSRTTTSSEEETDCSEYTSSREGSPAVSQIPSQVVSAKRRLVDAIMKEFQKVFSATLRNHATNGTNPSSSGSATGHPPGASAYSDTSFISRKRSLSGDGSTPPDDGDDSNKRRRPDSVSKGKQPISELRFACPYYKRNPGRHQTFTSCRDPGFTTVARLKEHLYRRHLLPPQCHRCCTTFTNDVALREHQRDPSGCELREQIPLEGFDKEQEKRMKSKKGSQMHHSEIEKWKAVYRILFPDDNDADMPSPYIEYKRNTANAAESSNSARFQEFSRLELPRLVRRTLESIVEHEAQPLEDRLKERLVDIVRQCQMQLETMFQTAAGPSNTRVEATLSSRAILSEQIVERPIDAHLPTTLSDSVSTDLQTKPEVKPSQLQIYEPSCQGGGVPEITDPISDSSDSGYDSISIAALSATGVHNELPQEHFDPNQYLDLSDYPHFPEVTTGTTVQSTQTDANDDHSMWFLVDNFPGTNHADSSELDCVHGLDHVW